MGFVPPPLPLPDEEIRRRIAAGARTPEQIDPAFAAWVRAGQRQQLFLLVIVALTLIAAPFIVIFWPK